LEHSTTSVPLDQFTDATRLYFDKKSVAEKCYNYEKLLQLGQPKIQAKHSGHGASAPRRMKLVDWTLFCFYPQKQK
jgi:hypothetical protein